MYKFIAGFIVGALAIKYVPILWAKYGPKIIAKIKAKLAPKV